MKVIKSDFPIANTVQTASVAVKMVCNGNTLLPHTSCLLEAATMLPGMLQVYPPTLDGALP